jgi:hypothetical protein
MEILQILKFLFCLERLDFNDQWVSREEDLSVVDISPEVIDDLLATHQIDDLSRLISEAQPHDKV